jgi:hypothetical protein
MNMPSKTSRLPYLNRVAFCRWVRFSVEYTPGLVSAKTTPVSIVQVHNNARPREERLFTRLQFRKIFEWSCLQRTAQNADHLVSAMAVVRQTEPLRSTPPAEQNTTQKVILKKIQIVLCVYSYCMYRKVLFVVRRLPTGVWSYSLLIR